jgi:hypothetical protein
MLSKSILSDTHCLRYALIVHADKIVSRWRKKSKEKRSELLLNLFPHVVEGLLGRKRDTGSCGLYREKHAAIYLIEMYSVEPESNESNRIRAQPPEEYVYKGPQELLSDNMAASLPRPQNNV